MNRRVVALSGSLAGLLALAGCGGPASAPPSTPPSSSVSSSPVAAGGAPNPCALLTNAQLRTLDQNAGESHPDADALGGISCAWTNFPVTADTEYVARLLPRPPASATPAAAVAGRPAAEYVPPNADRRTHCVVLVTLGPRTTLWARYGNVSGDIPGMTHDVACADARVAAAAMTQTYLRQGGAA